MLNKFTTAKNKKITFIILCVISLIFNIIIIDRFLLPKKIISDNLISYAEVTQTVRTTYSRRTSTRGYYFHTEKGFEFLTDKVFIKDPKIIIEHTLIFKNIVSIRNHNSNDHKELLTGLGGINAYFYLILAISSTISICYLKIRTNITDNAFLNIILFNAFMIFVLLIIWSFG